MEIINYDELEKILDKETLHMLYAFEKEIVEAMDIFKILQKTKLKLVPGNIIAVKNHPATDQLLVLHVIVKTENMSEMKYCVTNLVSNREEFMNKSMHIQILLQKLKIRGNNQILMLVLL